MSLIEQLWLPKKAMLAGWLLIAALIVAIGFQYYTGVETIKFVKTVVWYLVLDYIWTTIKPYVFP